MITRKDIRVHNLVTVIAWPNIAGGQTGAASVAIEWTAPCIAEWARRLTSTITLRILSAKATHYSSLVRGRGVRQLPQVG